MNTAEATAAVPAEAAAAPAAAPKKREAPAPAAPAKAARKAAPVKAEKAPKAVKPAEATKPAKAAKPAKPAAAAKAPAKPTKPVKPAKAAKPVKADKPLAKPAAPEPTPAERQKEKLVRDSFTMPRADFDLIDALKTRALGFLQPVKKSELLRAGLQALAALDDEALKARLGGLTALKAGRPKKHG